MFTNESLALEEAYDNLISNVSLGNIYAFLKVCWLIGDDQALTSTTLERIVYAEGDQQEVYTRRERQIVKSVSNGVYSHSFQLESSSGNIDCRFFAIELASYSNVIYDAIATMKILNKAIDGLNVFMFVTAAGVHFGCSSLTTHDALEDCILAYAINDKTDWEQLADMLLYRNDSQRVYEYYSGLLNLFDSIKYCREERDKSNIEWKLVNYDEVYDSDLLEDASSFSVEDFYPNEYSDQSDTQISMEVYWFEQEVMSCMSELSEIKKTHVNPLEMLFEAEKALFVSEQEATEEPTIATVESDEDLPDLDLLDDPIALMKKLKKDRGIIDGIRNVVHTVKEFSDKHPVLTAAVEVGVGLAVTAIAGKAIDTKVKTNQSGHTGQRFPISQTLGTMVDTVVDTGSNFDFKKTESFLKGLGYTVAKTIGLSDVDRQKILQKIISSGAMSKEAVCTCLEDYINLHKNQSKFSDAVSKWIADLAYVKTSL